MIWICIPAHNNKKYTIECLESLREQTFKDYKIIVCDDGSTDDTEEIIKKKFDDVKLLKGDGNLWWGGSINKCFKYSIANGSLEDYVLMLNNDLIVSENYLKVLIDNASQDTLLGSVVVDIENRNKIVYAGELLNKFTARSIQLNRRSNFVESNKEWEVDLLTGRGVIFPIKLLHEIGFIKTEFMPQYGGDSEFSARAKQKGYKLKILREAIVYSHIKNTANGSIYKKNSILNFFLSFFKLKSPNYYKSRYYFARTYTYKIWVPFFLFINFTRIWLGYFRRLFKK